jgi:hypothetical protein
MNLASARPKQDNPKEGMPMPPLIETAVRTLRLNRKVVLMLLLVPYLLVELAFNHRLLMLTSGTLDNQALRGVEIWGRIISGVGLGLLLWTFAMGRLLPKLSGLAALLLSLGLGVLCMWHAQRAAIDYWIDQAPARDKQISLALGMLATTAALGQLHTGHGPLMGPSASEGLRLTVASLFPASALHAAQRDDLVLAWTRQMGASYGAQDMARIAPELADNAYRNLIVPPLALGLSLLFALLNLAQLVSALLRYAALLLHRQWGQNGWVQAALSLALVAFSATLGNGYVDSEAFKLDLRPGLWQNDPLLALLTDWGLHAEPRWFALAEWAHNSVLLKASFKLPWG